MAANKVTASSLALAPYALLLGVLLFVYGLFKESILASSAIPSWLSASMFVAVVDLIYLLIKKEIFGWRARILFLSIVAIAGFGPAPFFTCLAISASAVCLGDLVLGSKNQLGMTLQAVVGWASYYLPFSLLIHWPVNFSVVYIAILAIPIAINPKPILCVVNSLKGWITIPKQSLSTRLAYLFACWVFLISACSLLLPTFMYDDRAFHLALGNQLIFHGKALFDLQHHLWAVTANAGDVLYAIPHLITGLDSRGPVNFIYFVVTFLLSEKILEEIDVFDVPKYLILALIFSLPITHVLAASMQTELLTTVMALAAVLALLKLRSGVFEAIYALLLLSACLVAIKTTGVFIVIPIIFMAVSSIRKILPKAESFEFARIAMVVGVAIAVGVVGYVYCYWVTGNPVFPLFNKVFKSPFFDSVNFFNPRFVGHFDWKLLYAMTFQSSRFFESGDGTLGFQFILFIPALVVSFVSLREKSPLIYVLIPAIFFILLVAAAQQYIRYIFPGLVLLTICLGVVWDKSTSRAFRKTLHVAAVVVVVMNLLRFSAVDWYVTEHPLFMLMPDRQANFIQQNTPEVLLNRYVNVTAGSSSRVLYAGEEERPFGVDLAGIPIYVNWYNQSASKIFLSSVNFDSMRQFMVQQKVTHVVLDKPLNYWQDNSPRKFMADVLKQYSVPLMTSGKLTLYRVNQYALRGSQPLLLNSNLTNNATGWTKIGQPQISNGVVDVRPNNYLLQRFALNGVTKIQLAYNAVCKGRGEIIVHVNWYAQNLDISPYYEKIPCLAAGSELHIERNLSVPSEAVDAEWYIEVGEGSFGISASKISLIGVS